MVVQRLNLEIDLNKLVKGKGYPIIKPIAEFSERDTSLVYGINQTRLNIKNQTHRNFLLRHLKNSFQINFKKMGVKCKGFLRVENQQIYLTNVNFYQIIGDFNVAVYDSHKRNVTLAVTVSMINNNYLLVSDDLKNISDGKFKVVFKGGFYSCLIAGCNLYFSKADKIR